MKKISITENLRIFDKYWQSKIIADFNGQNVKLVKIKGEFDWHRHKMQDELTMVLKGKLTIKFHEKDGESDVILGEGDLFVVKQGIDHKLFATEEVQALIIEAKSTLNTE